MEQQIAYSKLLHGSGHGIALKHPTQDIDVGDLCYWDSAGKAVRILNVFDNTKWLEENDWPKLPLTKEQAVVDLSTDANLQIVQGGGVWWGMAVAYETLPPSFDIYFQRLGKETAVIFPSAPTTITGLRTTTALQQWWSEAKRHAFRTWSYLINSPTGIFLVTKTVKTKRYAHCFSKGIPGEVSQIRIHGSTTIPNPTQVALPAAGTQWVSIRNDLEFKLEDCGDKGMYTIFIEREASRFYSLTDIQLKEEASKIWTSCCRQSAAAVLPPAGSSLPLPGLTSQQSGIPTWVDPLPAERDPFSPDLSAYWLASSFNGATTQPGPFVIERPATVTPAASTSTLPNWSTILNSSAATASRAPSPTPKFDGRDRLSLGDGWFIIKGDGSYFFELAGTGVDVSPELITAPNLLTVLKNISAKLAPPENTQSMNNMASLLANLQAMQAMQAMQSMQPVQSIPLNNWNAASLAGLTTISPQIALQLARQASMTSFPGMSLGGQFTTGYPSIPQINIPFTRPTAESNATTTRPPTIAFEIPWGWN